MNKSEDKELDELMNTYRGQDLVESVFMALNEPCSTPQKEEPPIEVMFDEPEVKIEEDNDAYQFSKK